MKSFKTKSERFGTPAAKRSVSMACALSIGLLVGAAPTSAFAESGVNKGMNVGTVLRKLAKKPSKARYATNARSPYVCTFTGFGKKGGCYRRASQ
jgi:hypothetical protein